MYVSAYVFMYAKYDFMFVCVYMWYVCIIYAYVFVCVCVCVCVCLYVPYILSVQMYASIFLLHED